MARLGQHRAQIRVFCVALCLVRDSLAVFFGGINHQGDGDKGTKGVLMQIIEFGLTGQPQQLPAIACGRQGCLLLRPAGAAAILIGTSAVEINLPLPEDRPTRVYPDNASELWAQGTAGQTLHLVVESRP